MSQMSKSSRKSRTRASGKGMSRELVLLLSIGIPIFALILFAAMRVTSDQEAALARSSTTLDTSQLVHPDSPTLGPSDAPVTLVEFLDPECEGCRAAYPLVKELLNSYEGQVRLVVRYVPRHNNSTLAAIATEAAGAQGQYWEMQELLFQTQPDWGEQTTSQREAFIGYAGTLGLDVEQFTADLENPTYAAKVERDLQDSLTLGIEGTPTFYVNGRLVTPLSEDTLQRMIEEALPN
jgi:protein-disulfide isomerase